MPDLVIDVNERRAACRQESYGLSERPPALPNTFPFSDRMPSAPSGELWRRAGCRAPSPGTPVLLHAGGVDREKPLERVIDAMAEVERPCFFLAFCAASEARIDALRQYAAHRLSPGRFCIRGGIPREELQPVMWEADIGVVDYAYSVEPTVNQKYCEPTKLYEFMASGLAVVASDNDSLRDIIEKGGIGFCSRGDDPGDLARALNRLLESHLSGVKTRAKRRFAEKYCYEKRCVATIETIRTKIREGVK